MEMKQAVKFTFDTRFDDGNVGSAPHAQVKTRFSKDEMERARSEAYAAGVAAGRTEASAESDRDIGEAMQTFAANATSLLAALQAESAALRGEAIGLAMTAAKKLAPALVAMQPEAEIEAVLRDCLQHLNREPHIVLRVADNLIERLKETVERMALERGLSGRIILLAQSDIAEGDCIVEWADGGVVRSRAEMEQEISDIISRFIETLSNPRAARNRLAMPETR
jgi:flagellar assembly protein FliH